MIPTKLKHESTGPTAWHRSLSRKVRIVEVMSVT